MCDYLQFWQSEGKLEQERVEQVDTDFVKRFLGLLEVAIDSEIEINPGEINQIEVIDSHLSSTIFIKHNTTEIEEYKVSA